MKRNEIIIDACYTAHKNNLLEKSTTKQPRRIGGRTYVDGKPSPITVANVRKLLGGGSASTITPIVTAYGKLVASDSDRLPSNAQVRELKDRFSINKTPNDLKKRAFGQAAKASKLSRKAFCQLITCGKKDGSEDWFEARQPPVKGEAESPLAQRTIISTSILGSCVLVNVLASGKVSLRQVLKRMPTLTTSEDRKACYSKIVEDSGLTKSDFARYTSGGNNNEGSVITKRGSTNKSSLELRLEQLAAAHLLEEVINAFPKTFRDKIEQEINSITLY
ncbi:DNA-binding protein [Porticoccaceae bacterium]|nr:DNA-binding protein [Porticoccaceae bacterium]